MKFLSNIFNLNKKNNTNRSSTTAEELNVKLWSDIRNVKPEDLESINRSFKKICKIHPDHDNENTKTYIHCHKYRLVITYKWIKKLITINNKNVSCFYMGSKEDIVENLLEDKFERINFNTASGDLRNRWSVENNSMDLVLSMEVLEHLSDFQNGFNEVFLKTGLKFVLREANRILKKNGEIFLTSPNASSAYVLFKTMRGGPQFNYSPHIREYTFSELKEELNLAGFEIEEFQTYHCCAWGDNCDYTKLFEALKIINAPIENKGDTIFIVARKIKDVL